MLAGLRKAGVIGLALLPADLLHPFSFGAPLLGPEDFRGATIRARAVHAPRSASWPRSARKPPTPSGTAFNLAVRHGKIDGAEWYFEGLIPGATTATGNVVFFPKVHALVVRTKVFDALTRAQRRCARPRGRGHAPRTSCATAVPDAKAAAQYCAAGGRIVAASPAEVAALVRAAAPADVVLQADPQTRRLIAAIRSLKRRTRAPAAIAPCGAAAPASTAPARTTARGPRIPDGVYRKAVTLRELLAAGATKSDAANNYGIETLTITGRRWRYDTRSPYRSPCSGPLRYPEAGRVELTTECAAATVSLVLSARWTLHGGELRFLDARDGSGVSPEARVIFGGRPWRKIG